MTDIEAFQWTSTRRDVAIWWTLYLKYPLVQRGCETISEFRKWFPWGSIGFHDFRWNVVTVTNWISMNLDGFQWIDKCLNDRHGSHWISKRVFKHLDEVWLHLVNSSEFWWIWFNFSELQWNWFNVGKLKRLLNEF